MRSYIKIYGPPVLKAIRALEKIAIEMPEVCIMDPSVMRFIAQGAAAEGYFRDYFREYELDEERCDKIISKTGERLGEYDFFFEWFKNPTSQELNELIMKIDSALDPLGCKYTITTKER